MISNALLKARKACTRYCSVQKVRRFSNPFLWVMVRKEDVMDVDQSADLLTRQNIEDFVQDIAADADDVT